jgi:hypothetical protein
VGRTVNTLYYATSQVIPRIDVLETELGDELGVNIRCRDGGYLGARVNTSPGLLQAYTSYLAPAIAYLRDLKTSTLIPADAGPQDAAVYVFVRNELESRESGGSAEGIADSLIIWALRNTGATEGVFLKADEILSQIESDVPGIGAVIGKIVPSRLKVLSGLPQPTERPIRYHSKVDAYAIAFDLKTKMQQENLQAETLRRSVSRTHRVRVLAIDPQASEKFIETVARVAIDVIQRSLEKEGIEFAAFLRGEAEQPKSMAASIEECLFAETTKQKEFVRFREVITAVLDEAFTNPTTDERLLYSKIAGVYTILFTLRAEPRLIQYFERLAGHFRLYAGSDVLIEAISERFLPERQKVFTNTLQLVNAAGGELILTEPVLEEVQRHINASNYEFRNHYEDAEDAITHDTLEFVNRPLIRAYFRGRLSDEKNVPRNWQQFLQNYCDPRAIESARSKEDLKKSLMAIQDVIRIPRRRRESVRRA